MENVRNELARYEGDFKNSPYLFRNRLSKFLERRYGKPIRQEQISGGTLISYFRTDEINAFTTECGDGYVFVQVAGDVNQMRDFGKTLTDTFGDEIKEI